MLRIDWNICGHTKYSYTWKDTEQTLTEHTTKMVHCTAAMIEISKEASMTIVESIKL